MQRAFCMGAFDPLSTASTGWVLRGTKVAQGARATSKKVKLGGLWGSNAGNLQDDVDACDTSEDTLSRGLCIDEHDPLAIGSAHWVLNQLDREDWVGTTKGQPESAEGGWPWNMWRSPTKSSTSAA
jgi:hypothetical protein